MSGLPLRALDLSSASQVMITLPQPSGTVFAQISGSASNLALDEQHFGAGADGIHWQTPDYNSTTHRYDLSVSGSVSNMTLARPTIASA